MKIRLLLFGLSTVLALYSCDGNQQGSKENDNEQVNTKQETPVKMIEQLVGEWQLDDTGAGAGADGRQPNDRLRFTEEARYIAYSGNQKVDSGAYRMNEQLRNLYLESESNEQPREYEIDLRQDAMTLKPRQPQEGQQNVAFSYRRVGGSPSRPNQGR